MNRRFLTLTLLLLVGGFLPVSLPAQPWKAGAAAVDITPQRAMRMAGYGGRLESFENVADNLQAKVLVLEDEGGQRFILVTTDLIGILRGVREDMEGAVKEIYGIEPSHLMLNASHTHCGPEYREGRGHPPEEVSSYNAYLREQILKGIAGAVGALQPATLSYAHAKAAFAMNRRVDYGLPADDPHYGKAINPDGPVDHAVPVLQVSNPAGDLQAIVFGYACHNTTLGGLEINGDYAGFAQDYLEEAHPGATALFVLGCGGDQNPHPRRTIVPGISALEMARLHGRTLALAVEAALNAHPRELKGALSATFERVDLDFAMPTRQELLERTRSGSESDQERARVVLQELDAGTVMRSYDYPVQVVRFGPDLTLVALGSEVVVDYSLRIKRELPGDVWVAGYSNDYFGYMPSLRILKEGDYEGGEANRGIHPGYWAPSVEERIMAKVHELFRRVASEGN